MRVPNSWRWTPAVASLIGFNRAAAPSRSWMRYRRLWCWAWCTAFLCGWRRRWLCRTMRRVRTWVRPSASTTCSRWRREGISGRHRTWRSERHRRSFQCWLWSQSQLCWPRWRVAGARLPLTPRSSLPSHLSGCPGGCRCHWSPSAACWHSRYCRGWCRSWLGRLSGDGGGDWRCCVWRYDGCGGCGCG